MSKLSLEQRIQQLEDIEAIKKLKAQWWFACDTRDLESMRACYDEDDFLIDFGFIGEFSDMDLFIATFKDLAAHPSHIDMHHGLAPEITIKSRTEASGRWRMRFQLLETEKNLVQLMHGYYEDEYVKIGEQWKMRVSKYTLQSNLLLGAEQSNLALLDIGSKPGLVTQQES